MVVVDYTGHRIESDGGGGVHVRAETADVDGSYLEEIELTSIEGDTLALQLTPTETFALGLALLRDYSLMTRGVG